MKKIEKYELIERYLLGNTSPSEKAEVEFRIKNDTEFANEVELHRNIQNLVYDSSLLEVKDTLQKIRRKKQLKLKRRTRFYRGLLVVGFCASILTISLLLIKNKDIAVRPASEAPEASEAFSDTIEPAILQKEIPQEKKEPQIISKETTVKSEPIGNIIPSTDKHKIIRKKVNPEGIRLKPKDEPELIEPPIITIPLPADDNLGISADTIAKPCNLNAQYLTFASCNSRPTGMIQIRLNSISGGTSPFKSALDGVYTDSMIYRNLKPGLYQLEIMDAAGCVKKFGFVQIDEKQCFVKDTIFSPDYEVWDIPIEPKHPGVLTIYNRSGQIVYQLNFDGSSVETWNGMNQKGEILPYGLYPFTIKYDDGRVFNGTVTIVGKG